MPLLAAPPRRDRRRNHASRIFGPPYPYFDRRASRRRVPGWQLRLRRSAAWRAVVGDVPPMKRLIDVVGALVLLIGLAPVMLAVVAVIKSHDGGPVFLWQTRVGRRGRCFACPSFRGGRKYHVDRLPRLWNVLAGDLSLVGPRPALPREVDRFTPRELRRLEVAPGLTGAWLVDGRDGVDRDIENADHPSVWRDVILLLRTPLAVLRTS